MAQSKAKLRSSEPSISITGPGGERLVPRKGGVHPNTSYDYTASGFNSANSSDADISDIRRAQRLSINMSHIDSSVPNRVIRTILRGDFATMQEEAEEGLRRSRLYLVATDLSDEAVYALEWTIGTILRDGDTLLAIYAVDEETGTGKSVDADASSSVQIGEGAKAAQDTVDAMTSQTKKMNEGPSTTSLLTPASYLPATSTDSRPSSADSRMLSKAELERQRAIEDISSTCVRLLRKTKLQVRVAIEVIHCKSPKHMITEAVRRICQLVPSTNTDEQQIDGLEPTLVILGSRGRSALKGVLLGSFSNYLVTKSSVPVMVARKKLRKHAKFKKTNIRLSNNLQRPNRLTSAKID
jgi:nucleotide-binding universal stress UspA family protein